MGENELMLVLGSTSEIAWATVQRLAQDKGQHWRFFLTGRNLAAVKQQAQQLAASTQQEVFFGYFDAMDDLTQHERLWRCVVPTLAVDAAHQQADDRQSPACTPVVYSVLPDGMVQAAAAPSVSDRAGPLGAVFCAVGYLGQREQVQDLEADAEHERVWRCNYSGLLPLLNRAAMYFEQRGYGRLLVISSVAGERGRCSNFFYGAAKGGRRKNFEDISHVLTQFGVLPIYSSLERYGYIKAGLERKGQRIDDFDLLIGATALQYSLVVVTANAKHLSRIPDLKIMNWETESIN